VLGGSYIVRNNKNRPIYYCKIVLAVARVGGGAKIKKSCYVYPYRLFFISFVCTRTHIRIRRKIMYRWSVAPI